MPEESELLGHVEFQKICHNLVQMVPFLMIVLLLKNGVPCQTILGWQLSQEVELSSICVILQSMNQVVPTVLLLLILIILKIIRLPCLLTRREYEGWKRKRKLLVDTKGQARAGPILFLNLMAMKGDDCLRRNVALSTLGESLCNRTRNLLEQPTHVLVEDLSR